MPGSVPKDVRGIGSKGDPRCIFSTESTWIIEGKDDAIAEFEIRAVSWVGGSAYSSGNDIIQELLDGVAQLRSLVEQFSPGSVPSGADTSEDAAAQT